MPKGVYAAASAMFTEQRLVEVHANNMANATAAGFKRSEPLRDDFENLLARAQNRTGPVNEDGGAGALFAGVYHIFKPGEFIETGNSLDVAITGEAFFAVENESEEVLLTRNGHFSIDENGQLFNDSGHVVLGQGGGPITIPPDAAEIQIDPLGNISVQVPSDAGPVETLIDRLRVVTVDDPTGLEPRSGQYFAAGGQVIRDAIAEDYTLNSGMIENANVDAVSEMVDMISAQRRYDAAQRALTEQLNLGGDYSRILAES